MLWSIFFFKNILTIHKGNPNVVMKNGMKMWMVMGVVIGVAMGVSAWKATSGYIPTDVANGVEMFYWMMESQSNPQSDPLVLWLTGGPGCSSDLAALFENGPWFVSDQGQLQDNPNSWNKIATVVYLDQPPGAGFSYAEHASGRESSSVEVGNNVWKFLQGFLSKHPEYVGRDFYVTGESYGGHWVPNVATAIHRHNYNLSNSEVHIPLKGLAIGNGWVDPYYQAGSYAPFLYANGLIGESTVQEANSQLAVCQSNINSGDYSSAFSSCGSVLDICLQAAGNINVYDIKKPCIGPLCYDLNPIIDYLNEPSVQAQLGVNRTWTPCSSVAYGPFETHDFEFSYRYELPGLLEQYEVLIYNGVLDLMCNYFGTSAYLDAMQWSGASAFANAANTTWGPDGTVAGTRRSAGRLHYYTVNNAGHMVPYDQGKAALQLLSMLLNGGLGN